MCLCTLCVCAYAVSAVIYEKSKSPICVIVESEKECKCMYAQLVHEDTHGDQRRVSDPREMKLQAVVNFLMWILGTELWSSARATRDFHHWTISPALFFMSLYFLEQFNIQHIPWSLRSKYAALCCPLVFLFLFILSQ